VKDQVEARIRVLGERYLLHPRNHVPRLTPFEGVKEREVAKYLKTRVAALGGEVRRVQWEGRAHAPDYRVLLFKHGKSLWIETKRPGEEARKGQQREHDRLRKAGDVVLVLDSIDAVDEWVEGL
jgi:hypothetical protein